jgi:hypothetical protein
MLRLSSAQGKTPECPLWVKSGHQNLAPTCRASSFVSSLAAERRPGSSSK